ncbi:MAG TPA: hypothetical protein VFU19_17680 [Iamia sp.]|nr:hypothetical protein [Iamia sp.]
MKGRDDRIFALLRAFRADEARIDDAIRSRIWADIVEHDPEAALWLDTLDRGARVGHLRRRAARPARIMAVAAVLVLLAVVQLALHSTGPSEQPFVSAGPSTTVPIPRDLDDLADRVTLMLPEVLGETEDTRYTYLRGVHTGQADPTRAVQTFVEQRWVAADGSGRELIDNESTGRAPDEHRRGPGFFNFGPLTPSAIVSLPDDGQVVLDSISRDPDPVAGDGETALALVELLTYAGFPGPARAGALRALDRLGFEPAPGPDPAPTLWRVEGPGPDGLRVQVDFDLHTGEVAAWTRLTPGGGFIRLTNIETDLRPDSQGP